MMIQILELARKMDIKCALCRSKETYMDKRGKPVWRYNDQSQRICYRCKLSHLKKQRESISKATRCQSEVCVKAREKMGAKPEYDIYAHCMDCKTNHAKELKTCPCCHLNLRKKPRYNREKKKNLAPKLKV